MMAHRCVISCLSRLIFHQFSGSLDNICPVRLRKKFSTQNFATGVFLFSKGIAVVEATLSMMYTLLVQLQLFGKKVEA